MDKTAVDPAMKEREEEEQGFLFGRPDSRRSLLERGWFSLRQEIIVSLRTGKSVTQTRENV